VDGFRFSFRRFTYALGAFLAVLAVGTVVFQALLDEGWVSSLYRAVVTTTLTGLDTKPDGAAAELFSIGLLLAGVAIFLYLAGAVVEAIAQGVLGGNYADRRRRRTIESLHNHVVICGFGRVGRGVAEEIQAVGGTYVVIDVNEEAVRAATALGALVIHGDGTDDGDLERAGLLHARALVACADSDENNLYITLSARAARPGLVIVARASSQEAARKLRLAGADRVVEPYSTAGRQIATVVMKPQVADFLDIVTTAAGPLPELRIEEIVVTASCLPCRKSIRELRIQETTGAMVIALRKADGSFDVTPDPDTLFEVGDVVIGVGTTGEIHLLEELFAPREAVVG
jgi:voltage-gated potassium channel